jgi:hypothetical protein
MIPTVCNQWGSAKKINRYTGLPNSSYFFEDGSHCTVYMRKNGYSFTSRIPLKNKLWIQESLGSHAYLPSEEEAQIMAIDCMKDIKSRLIDLT